MVEVAHDDLEAFVLFAQEMIDRDLDVVELNVGSSSCRRVAGLHNVRKILQMNLCTDGNIP